MPPSGNHDQPQILSATILPGRGMNTYQFTAFVPGRGEVDMLDSPPLEQGARQLSLGAGDEYGNASFKLGGAILVPFANRIRGKLDPDGKTIETTVLGKKVTLIANWKGGNPGAEPNAMHGLILASVMQNVRTQADDNQASVSAGLDAGDFGGHWPSDTRLDIAAALDREGFTLTVTAKNAGHEDLPVGIGWHPYFKLPSGDRRQARVHIPASARALVNNYDDVFPTGKLVPITGTPYDVAQPGGVPLADTFFDDCFVKLKTPVAEIRDSAAKYGVRIEGRSPQISAYQMYAPPARQIVVLEPQFNWADPFNPVWKGEQTGMAVLKPGQSVTYSVRLSLFIP